MEPPKQTAQIFEILSKGQFISANSSDDLIRRLYHVVDDEDTYDCLYSFFRNINYTLEKGNGYYYFSRVEKKTDLERKIEQAYRWIDILDFLKTYDNSFGSGTRFTPHDILVRININAELKSKVTGLKKYIGESGIKHSKIVEGIIKDLKQDKFVELENEISQTYKVLDSFKYLEELVLTLNINEEAEHEIPE